MSSERNHGIDLLRILLMFFVCIQHVLGCGGVFASVENGSIQDNVYSLLNIISRVSVDGFALISGYMSFNKKPRYEKIIQMWFQVFFYSFIVSIILIAIGIKRDIEPVAVLSFAYPISSGSYWYFTAFFTIFLAMPIVNSYVQNIDKLMGKKALILFAIIFTVFGSVSDAFITQKGFSPFWLLLLSFAGALAGKCELFKQKSTSKLMLAWLANVIITWCTKAFFHNDLFISYTSPTIVINAMILVVLFNRLSVKVPVATRIAPYVFGIYLFHTNPIIWTDVLCDSMTFIGKQPLALGIVSVLIASLCIFILGLIVDYVRAILFNLMKIPKLSSKIVSEINDSLTRYLDKLD